MKLIFQISKISKYIISGVLLVTSIIGIIGDLSHYFVSNKKPSEEPVKVVIEKEKNNQEITESNNEENIKNKEKEKKQPEIIINNEYIPVIDCLWLNIPAFIIVMVVGFIIVMGAIFVPLENMGIFGSSFILFEDPCEKELSIWVKTIIVMTLTHQVVVYVIWFILMLIFAAFSKIWDKEHSWWSNVVKGSFRNRIHRGWWSLIPILLTIIAGIFFVIVFKKDNAEQSQYDRLKYE